MLTNPFNWNGNYLQLMKTKFQILLLTALKENSKTKQTHEMRDVDSMFPQPAAVTLNKTRLEKQQVPTFKLNEDSWGKSLDNLPPFSIKEIE